MRKYEGTSHPPDGGMRYDVFVVRDSSAGDVYYVGCGAEDLPIDLGRAGLPNGRLTTALARAIRDDGRALEYCMVARGLATKELALAAQQASVAAITFSQPGVSVHVLSDDELRLATSGRPSTYSSFPEPPLSWPPEAPDWPDAPAQSEDGYLDTGHRERLEQLILAQQSELDHAHTVLARVKAVRDFAQWSERSTGSSEADAIVRASDLTQALGDADRSA